MDFGEEAGRKIKMEELKVYRERNNELNRILLIHHFYLITFIKYEKILNIYFYNTIGSKLRINIYY